MHLQHFVPRRLLLTSKRGWNTVYVSFTIAACCMLLFLSSCADQAGANTSGTLPGRQVTVTSTSQPVPTKTDSNGDPTEDVFRSQLAKVQRIMDGMSLDQ